MAVVFALRNARTIDALCDFTVYRYTRVDPLAGLTIQTPCSLCIEPGNKCNLVRLDRVYTYDASESTWTLGGEIHLLGAMGTDVDLEFHTGVSGCVWDGSYVYERTYGDEFVETLTLSLAITINSGDSSKVDMALSVGVGLTGDISGGPHSIDYTRTAVDPTTVGPLELTTADTRFWDIDGSNSITWPTSITLNAADPT